MGLRSLPVPATPAAAWRRRAALLTKRRQATRRNKKPASVGEAGGNSLRRCAPLRRVAAIRRQGTDVAFRVPGRADAPAVVDELMVRLGPALLRYDLHQLLLRPPRVGRVGE